MSARVTGASISSSIRVPSVPSTAGFSYTAGEFAAIVGEEKSVIHEVNGSLCRAGCRVGLVLHGTADDCPDLGLAQWRAAELGVETPGDVKNLVFFLSLTAPLAAFPIARIVTSAFADLPARPRLVRRVALLSRGTKIKPKAGDQTVDMNGLAVVDKLDHAGCIGVALLVKKSGHPALHAASL